MEIKKKTIEEKTSLKREDGQYEIKPSDELLICPSCGKKGMEIGKVVYNLPDGDDVLIMNMTCDLCNYKKNDMVSLFSAFQPGKYHLTIDDGDFSHKIFRGATGDLHIDKIGVTIERGPAAQFEFTNVEGILTRIKSKLQFFINSNPDDTIEWKNAQTSYEMILKCMDGTEPFIIELDDKEGGSYINPTNKQKMIFSPYEKKN